MIDDQNLHRRLMRFEFQPKLLLDRSEDRRRGDSAAFPLSGPAVGVESYPVSTVSRHRTCP